MKIVMTEKDFYKVSHYGLNKINFLKVNLEIINKNKFLTRIKNL